MAKIHEEVLSAHHKCVDSAAQATTSQHSQHRFAFDCFLIPAHCNRTVRCSQTIPCCTQGPGVAGPYAGMSKARGSTLSLLACQCAGSASTCWGQPPGIWKETGRTRAAVTSTVASVLARPLVAAAPSCTAASLAATRATALGMLLKHILTHSQWALYMMLPKLLVFVFM